MHARVLDVDPSFFKTELRCVCGVKGRPCGPAGGQVPSGCTGHSILIHAHRLHWHKNADGEYADPVLGKVFTQHTHIVAIKTSGNVYAFEVCGDWEGGWVVTEMVRVWRLLAPQGPGCSSDIWSFQDHAPYTPCLSSARNRRCRNSISRPRTCETY